MSTTITAIILTYNEEQHISRCISSLSGIADEIVVVDSYSSDNTIEIAERLGAKVYQNPFINQAIQFNWALNNCPIQSEWILRIDADEYLENKNSINLTEYLQQLPKEVKGLHISRKIVFMGHPLLHGGWYPKWNLRIFKYGFGKCENRWMDEHIVLSEGINQKIKIDFVDENLNDLSWWIAKHNNYSTREAFDFFLTQGILEHETSVKPRFWGNDAERKRWLKSKYHSFPLFIRPFFNLFYRYIILLGFLDGNAGFIWHVLQGFWYRFLVDAKIYELKHRFHNDREAIVEYIKKAYNIQ